MFTALGASQNLSALRELDASTHLKPSIPIQRCPFEVLNDLGLRFPQVQIKANMRIRRETSLGHVVF
jgi:hypothetical protein